MTVFYKNKKFFEHLQGPRINLNISKLHIILENLWRNSVQKSMILKHILSYSIANPASFCDQNLVNWILWSKSGFEGEKTIFIESKC